MFAIILTYKKPLEEVERHTPAHRAFLDEGYAKGLFVMSGRQTPPVGGVIIANVADRETLESILAEDPFRREDVAEYAIYEFTPAKYHSALKDLIESVPV